VINANAKEQSPRSLSLHAFAVRVCAPVAPLLRKAKRSGLFFLAARITASNIKYIHSYANVLEPRATSPEHPYTTLRFRVQLAVELCS